MEGHHEHQQKIHSNLLVYLKNTPKKVEVLEAEMKAAIQRQTKQNLKRLYMKLSSDSNFLYFVLSMESCCSILASSLVKCSVS